MAFQGGLVEIQSTLFICLENATERCAGMNVWSVLSKRADFALHIHSIGLLGLEDIACSRDACSVRYLISRFGQDALQS